MSDANTRALRRLVTKLAEAESDDVRDILSSLDDASRRTVEGLLQAYSGNAPVPASDDAFATAPRFDGLSPWLAQRLCGDSSGALFDTGADTARHGDMTPGAAKALRACALTLAMSPAKRVQRLAPQGETWLDRLSALLIPRARTS